MAPSVLPEVSAPGPRHEATTIDHHLLTGNERRCVGSEEEHELRDLGGIGNAPHGKRRQHGVACPLLAEIYPHAVQRSGWGGCFRRVGHHAAVKGGGIGLARLRRLFWKSSPRRSVFGYRETISALEKELAKEKARAAQFEQAAQMERIYRAKITALEKELAEEKAKATQFERSSQSQQKAQIERP